MSVPPAPPALRAAQTVAAGGSEMAARCRAFDWAATPLGPVAGWPPALATAVRLVLDAPGAMSLYVGPAFVTLYNDAYRRVLGAKHPAALGRPAAEVWAEIWPTIGPQYEEVRAGGPGLDLRDVPFTLARLDGGAAEEGWFDYALSGVRGDGAGDARDVVVAILSVVTETTARMRAEQALALERVRLAEVFAQAPAFLAVLRGPENVFELVNAAYEQIIGRGRDVVGRPLFEAIPEARGQGFDGYLAQVRATGEPLVFRDLPVLLDRTPGAAREERFLDITYLPLRETDAAGRVMHEAVIAHGTDVTDQVRARRAVEAGRAVAERAAAALAESEARFRAVEDASPDAILLLRPVRDAGADGANGAGGIVDFEFTYANAPAGRMLGGGRIDALVGARMLALFPQTGPEGYVAAYARAFETGVPYAREDGFRLAETTDEAR